MFAPTLSQPSTSNSSRLIVMRAADLTTSRHACQRPASNIEPYKHLTMNESLCQRLQAVNVTFAPRRPGPGPSQKYLAFAIAMDPVLWWL